MIRPQRPGEKRVLVVGEINVDLVLQGRRDFPTLGKEVRVDDFTMVLGSASAICARGLGGTVRQPSLEEAEALRMLPRLRPA